MREIKFRAWSSENKVMLNEMDIEDYVVRRRWGNNYKKLIYLQFTGLKDKNGKEIYEGDIIKCHRLRNPGKHCKNIDFSIFPWPENHWYDCVEIGLIQWSETSFGFVEDYEHVRRDDISNLSIGTSHRYEIIGNIFENPELLNSPANLK